MSDVKRVIAFIRSLDCEIDAPLLAGTSLIQSGLMDSLALYELALWIEQQVDKPLELSAIDIPVAWETPSDIAAFIGAERRARP